ncbi:type VI secretion system tube protein Hcp, partial [Escherichia coli]
HMESVSMQYEKITWRIVDGNMQFSDSWYERPTA